MQLDEAVDGLFTVVDVSIFALGENRPVSGHVKVRFGLDRDEDGWPPAESEGLWAVPLEGNLYRVDNTPWFVRGVAADDVVEAEQDANGVLWFERVHERGGRLVVRIVPRPDGPLDGDRQAVLDQFAPLGVKGEGISSPINMVALDIGPEAPLPSVKSLLVKGEADGDWYYEEGSISEEWRRL